MSTSETTEGVLARWAPSRDSAAAFLTELGMIAAYAILGGNSGNLGVAALIGLIVVPVLAVGIPVYSTAHLDVGHHLAPLAAIARAERIAQPTDRLPAFPQ